AFHESLNFAALKQTPVIFICENNLYAIHSHQGDRHAAQDICRRAAAYGIPAERIEDNDVLRIHECVSKTVEKLRNGEPGPFFFECMTYRWMEHVGPNQDYDAGYRPRSEMERWLRSDQVQRIGLLLSPAV